jgi:dethiobiotin synthetase
VRGYFVTGTDTGVGKTFVTSALARRARAYGHRVFAFKPIETGCELVDTRRMGADQERLALAAGDWQRGDLRGVYKFLMPAAPLVAAVAEGTTVDLGLIEMRFEEGASQADLVLVEGAGGWRVPITSAADTGALAGVTGLPIIVVARATLGTINHSLLTIEAIERDGHSVSGLVLSRHPADDPEFAQSNADQIRARWPGNVLVFGQIETDLDVLLV